MSMSRKDFVMVAKCIAEARDRTRRVPDSPDSALRVLARDLAIHFADANPNFNYTKFMEACEPKSK